jgi:recombination protein RecA
VSYVVDPRAAALAAKINKQHGEGAVTLASEMIVPRRFISGSLSLDASLNGGWAGNHWAEVYGPENHGKTAITLKTLAANQQQDPNFFTLWVASEHYDIDQATALGVDTNRVQVLSTQDMSFAYQTVIEYLNERAADFIVIDSYPALIAPEEDEKEMDEYTRAEGAKMTNKFFRKVGKAGLRNPLDSGDRPWFGVFINQPRDSMKTVWGGPGKGQVPMETTPGGRGKNFAFYTRLNVKRAEWIYEGPKSAQHQVGQVIRTQAIKHKGGPPQRVASIDFFFTEAPEHDMHRGDYDIPKDVLTTAILFDVVRKSGGWYKFEDRQWQGLPTLMNDIRAEEALLHSIEKRTREALERPDDKRTYGEAEVASAATAKTTVRRRKRGESGED